MCKWLKCSVIISSLTIGDNAFPQILLVELGNWEVRGQNLTVTCGVAKKKDQVLQVFSVSFVTRFLSH